MLCCFRSEVQMEMAKELSGTWQLELVYRGTAGCRRMMSGVFPHCIHVES